MKPLFDASEFSEPERYELHEGRYDDLELSRRAFVQVLGAGLLISVATPRTIAQRRGNREEVGPFERLHLGEDGTITVLTGKVEVGQGARTQILQAAAEELGESIDRIRLIMADSALVPDDGGTAGSRTTPSTVPSVRRGCAAARRMLIEAAALRFGIESSALSIRNGKVEGGGLSETFGYTDLVSADRDESSRRESTAGVQVKPVSEWSVLGTPVAKVNAAEVVTGEHRYPSDIIRSAMLYGVVLRPPSYGAVLLEIDLAQAEGMTDVMVVHAGDFVGFAAPTSFMARKARDLAAKTARWQENPQPPVEALYAHLRENTSSGGRSRRDRRGSPEAALEGADETRRATFEVAYIQHAPMEPRAAVAEWSGDQLTVWTGTQQPARVRTQLADALGVSVAKVRLIVPDTGGGFGGKHTGEAAVEAARLALATKRPVSVRWSREEEFTWAYFRPAGVIDVSGGLDDSGNLVGWEQVNFNSGSSAIATPYDVPNSATEYKACDQPLRSGSYRGLASVANTFARESMMDELALAADLDPLEFRLKHLTNTRLRGVLKAAAEGFGWRSAWKNHPTPQRQGVGLACGIEKGSYVATCAKVGVDENEGTYRIIEVCQAFECGAVQNPANLKAQVEGCIIQGLGALLFEEIRFANGRILNPRFSMYPVPRFRHVPAMKIILLDRPDLPSVGAGETPIIGIAPAVANALYNSAKVRIRSLPLRNRDWRAA